MAQWSSIRKLRRWLIAVCTSLLTKPLRTYVQRVPNDVDKLKKTLRKGDVLLVEGDQRISQVIRYLTQSSWSHCCLYVGDELLKGDPRRAADLIERFGGEAQYLLIEADHIEGVAPCTLSKYERYNIRICRPHGLHRDDVGRLLAHVIAHLGRRYNVRHIVELARFFFPVSVVPRRWRRAALTFGSGSTRAVICSSMIAEAYAQVGYPILPQVTIEGSIQAPRPWWQRVVSRNGHHPIARFRRHNPALVTPRDFDLSPYFQIVKFNHLGDPNFDYRQIIWEDAPGLTPPQHRAQAQAPVSPDSAQVAQPARRRLRYLPSLLTR